MKLGFLLPPMPSPIYGRAPQQVCSSESSGFSLTLKKCENIVLSDWSLNVSDQGSVVVTDESDLNLCNTSSGAYKTNAPSQNMNKDDSFLHTQTLPSLWRVNLHAVLKPCSQESVSLLEKRLTGFANDFIDSSVNDFGRVHVLKLFLE